MAVAIAADNEVLLELVQLRNANENVCFQDCHKWGNNEMDVWREFVKTINPDFII